MWVCGIGRVNTGGYRVVEAGPRPGQFTSKIELGYRVKRNSEVY
jgi:hypothetical protein